MTTQPAPSAFQVHASDNVATLLGDAAEDATVIIVGQGAKTELASREKISMGHKIALANLKKETTVLKYGHDVGRTVAEIGAGRHVHTHNLKTKRW